MVPAQQHGEEDTQRAPAASEQQQETQERDHQLAPSPSSKDAEIALASSNEDASSDCSSNWDRPSLRLERNGPRRFHIIPRPPPAPPPTTLRRDPGYSSRLDCRHGVSRPARQAPVRADRRLSSSASASASMPRLGMSHSPPCSFWIFFWMRGGL